MFTRILGALILVSVGSCSAPKKQARFIDKSEATVPFEEFRSDFNEPGFQQPGQDRPLGSRSFGQEPDKILIAGDYRQENNNSVLLELDQTLLGKFTGFSLPVIPKGGTQSLVPEFPQSWVWNATKDQYETTGRAMRPDGSMENVHLVAKTYPNFDFLDVSMTVTVRPGDQIATTFTSFKQPALSDLDAGGVSFSRSRCDRDRDRDRDRDHDHDRCDRDHDHDDDDDDCGSPRPRPRPQPCPDRPSPQPCPYPECPDYPDGRCDSSCPNDPDCRPRCPDYPDGHCDGSCPNDPDCRPRCPDYPDGVCDNTCPNDPDCKPRCPTYPDGHCDGSCPNDPDCRPRCPDYPDGVCDNTCPNDPDCKPRCPTYPDGNCDRSCPNDPDCKPQECPPGCTTCCCTCTGGEQAQEKTFVYKFKKID